MLQQLYIQNYAIIDSIRIKFSAHLNIITGETGAGKSIIAGALNLILGERADSAVLANHEKKCFIEGTFKAHGKSVKDFLQQHDLDAEDELIIRREIAVNGKSRAFVNDTPVTLSQLKTLSHLLVDLHQQFDTQDLSDNNFQREVIDALAGNAKDIIQYQSLYKNYRSITKELETLTMQQASANKELDYNKFLLNELEDANLLKDEIEDAEAQIKLLSNAESIKSSLADIYFEMEESENPLVQKIKSISNKLQSLKSFHHNIEALHERLQSAQIELQDIADEIDIINNSVSYDAEKINALNERVAAGYRLLKKHNVTTTAQLFEIKNHLSKEVEKVTDLAHLILVKEQQAKQLHEDAVKIAEAIHEKRKLQLQPFVEKVNALLRQVGMPNARLKVNLQKSDTLNFFGTDAIEFLFNANVPADSKGSEQKFEPLRKVASGGELSRLMLSIKSLVAKSVQLPVLVFDEIDTGISGEAARQVGNIMKELSAKHQIIAITHQPQIAAKAEAHFFVHKEIRDNKIVTAIRQLTAEERITTIATMLSGERPTAAAFANAREMIGN